MVNKTEVGKRIAVLRKALDCSQSAFAEKLNVSTQAVSKWENGVSLPDIEVLLNISWITKVSLHTLLEGENFIESQNGVERGIVHLGSALTCPKCYKGLRPVYPQKQEKLKFECSCGNSYHLVDGVIHFGSREVEGEQWSLWLQNYQHYLEEQRHIGNPRYLQGSPHYKEVMWRQIEKLRPRTILDIACGTGSGIKYIIERINWPVTVIMADLSHRILKWNKVFYAEEWHNPYVDMVYMACDCSNLPLADNSVDVVFSNFGFESMQSKKTKGFHEALRVLKPSAHAVYTVSAVDDYKSENTQRWLELYKTLDKSYQIGEKLSDINDWLSKCEKAGFERNEVFKVYDELPAPSGDTFPFENEVLQWMANYIVVSQK